MVGAIGIETIGIVALVAIVIFGGSKIPELARGLGRAKSEFQKGLSETSTDPAEGKAKGKVNVSAKKARELLGRRRVFAEGVGLCAGKLAPRDLEQKEVIVKPVERQLNAAMELGERIRVGNADLTPDGRLDVSQRDTKNEASVFRLGRRATFRYQTLSRH